jgi:hypothetical protein
MVGAQDGSRISAVWELGRSCYTPVEAPLAFDTSQPIELLTVVPRCIYYLYLMPLYCLLPAGDVGMDKKGTRRVSGK